MTELMQTTAQALEAHGFEVYIAATAAEAKQKAIELIQPGWSVGVGGSMTVRELGLVDALEAAGHPVWWHWTSPEEKALVWENARKADIYLASANAVTTAGQLVNIDGTGNRVAAMIQGPATVLAIVGCNKLVNGGIPAAIARIQREACPPNARRLGLNTPCAATGQCNVSACGPDCMCHATTILTRPLRGQRYIVLLVEEKLGY